MEKKYCKCCGQSIKPGYSKGERHGSSKLKEADIRVIREMVSGGWLQKDVAEYFGVRAATISSIKTRKRWGWLV